MEKVRHYATVYYLLQGLAASGWWAALFLKPEVRIFFRLEPGSDVLLIAFALPDALFWSLGSFATGFLIYTRNRYALPAMWLVTGATSYAAIYTFSLAVMTDSGWLGVVLMFPAMLWSGIFAVGMTVGGDMFRRAKGSSTNYVMFKTFLQIVIVWTIILLVFPYLITIVEDKIGLTRLQFPLQGLISGLLFVLLSSVGVYSAMVMSRIGKGTPLPLDHATDLVVTGPYAYVRNPMAVSGVGQGLAVALFLGSPLVALYALMGSAIWQLVFRPLEEDDMTERFGAAYEQYRTNVKCWLPNTNRFDAESR